MIGRPEWFGRRKYTGWGIIPKTWQGWVYIALLIIPFAIFQSIPIWSVKTRLIVTGIWIAAVLLDVGHIMVSLKLDEREYKIEAIAERNASWAMIAVMIAGMFYQMFTTPLNGIPRIDWFLAAALIGGLIAKGLSNFILERKAI